jgi:2-dehydro-3-deoxyphosphooctonate aldolase (KDO 8-P synthase)
MTSIQIGKITIGGGSSLVLIAGPCVIEGRDMILATAEHIVTCAQRCKIPVIFKSSYKKANRTSVSSFSSLGMDQGLKILEEVKQTFDIPILTDIHTESEAAIAAEVADVLQIPAFLSRQTDLLQAAGKTGRVVNIKKGQFLAPDDMKHAAEKVVATGNSKILLTERGTTFGYHNLVVDMRGLAVMRKFGFPVVLDVTHSLQLPGGDTDRSGGEPEFIFPIARAGVAVGIDAIFIETHPDPQKALSDASTQLPLSLIEQLMHQIHALDQLVRTFG